MTALANVVFIGGAGHSGSTLLGLMLGAHPSIFYAGEGKKSLYLRDETKPPRKRACKLCGPRCPVWGDFQVDGDNLYATLARRTGRSIVVDSSKSRDWIERQSAKVGAASERLFVFLARDGRAVVCSRLRKYPSRGARAHAEDWVAQIRATEDVVARFPGRVMRLRYEDLAARPDAMIGEVSRFVGVDPVPAMVSPWSTHQHPLGGNDGAQSLMRRAAFGADEPSVKSDHYRAHPTAIVLDLRWQREMTEDALAAFESIAGGVNERLGYSAGAPPREPRARATE